MRNSIANRTLLALFSSLLLALSIAVLADGPGQCPLAVKNKYLKQGQCIPDDLRTWVCVTDYYDPGNCDAPPSVNKGCHLSTANENEFVYPSNANCFKGLKTCAGTPVSNNRVYYGNWGTCVPETSSSPGPN
jgi:hypothetical protein